MAQKVTQYLLIALMLSLGFGQLLRLETGIGPVFVHDILLVFVVLLSLGKVRVSNLPLGLKVFMTGLMLGWIRALSLYPLTSLLTPFFYSLRLLSYLALYLLLERSQVKIEGTYLRIAGAITLVIGLIQYLFFPDMRLFEYLGWDDHLNRVSLPHYDPTFTAAMLGMCALLNPMTRPSSPLAYGVGILLTYSRSIWISLLLTLPLLIKKKSILLVTICCLLFIIAVLPRRFGEGNNLGRTYSIISRLESDWSYIDKHGWDLLIGRGMNTLPLDKQQSEYPDHATGPNNSYLYLLATTGIIGLSGWLLFLRSLYRTTLHQPLIVFVGIASLFNNVMFYPFTLLLLLLSMVTVPSGGAPSSLSHSQPDRSLSLRSPGLHRQAGKGH